MTDAMTTALTATGPRDDRAEAMSLYGRLVGTWEVGNRYVVEPSGTWQTGTVVWRFGWILAGQAVQDVMWFIRDGDSARETGSTVRLYDPAAGAWHIVWFSPAGTISVLTGRPGENGDIVQEGTGSDGRPIRWLFTEVTESSFRWLGYVSDDDGATWRFEQEMLAKRSE
jgi:hypothetical protein